MNNRVNQQFGSYRLVRMIGRGGFAEVYLGEHLHLSSQVAIKILNTQLMTREKEEFLEEARIVAGLSHPSIVRVLDCGIREEDDTPYLIMNYAPNGTLRQLHPKGEVVPLPQAVSYVKQIASALQYAHTRKLIHRDIKPENMLIGEENEILLSDFGIALISASSSSQSTKATAGTMVYMAPEQIMGKPRMASDQYALAIVLYEWLCGERPFQGNFSELCAQHLYAPPPSLHEKLPSISLKLENIIFKALEKDPLKRYARVLDFAEALERYNIHGEEEDEEPEDDVLLFDVGQVRGAAAAPVIPQDNPDAIILSEENVLPTIPVDDDVLPTVLMEERQEATDPNLKIQQDKVADNKIMPVLEDTMLAPPPVDKGYEKTQISPLNPKITRKIPVPDPILAIPVPSPAVSVPKERRLRARQVLILVLTFMIIGGSLSLAPLLIHASQPKPKAHQTQVVIVPTSTPTKESALVSKKLVSIGHVVQRPTPTPTDAPQVIVTTGGGGVAQVVPTPTPTRASVHIVPTPTPTTVPTPDPTAVPAADPTAVPTVVPTTPVVVQPKLQSTPSSYVNSFDSCSEDSHGGVGQIVSCSFTLSNTGGSAQVLNWNGAVSNSNYSLTPASGSIAPGQSESVSLTMGASCPLSFNVTFTGPANTVTVPMLCTEISVTPDAQSFSSSNCTHGATGYWFCTITVTALTANAADTNWAISIPTGGPTSSPQSGTLAPGASTQVVITIPPSSCPGSNNFDFYVPGSTVDGFDNYLNWSC